MQQDLPTKLKKDIDIWVNKFPQEKKRSSLLMALKLAQDEYGWLSDQTIDAIADYLNLPHAYAYEVVSFYSLYRRKPCGKHVIKVCTSISCHLRNSTDVINYCQNKLGIKLGETTEDGQITLEETECIAACAGAPALQVDDRTYHEHVNENVLDKLIHDLQNKERAHD